MKYLVLLALSGCGIHVSSDPVKVEPVTVNHVVSIDLAKVTAFCQADCVNSPDYMTCTSECFDKFINIFNLAAKTTQ